MGKKISIDSATMINKIYEVIYRTFDAIPLSDNIDIDAIYEIDNQTNKIKFSHNPFSMPQGEMESLINKDPLDIKAYQYDIVCTFIFA